MSAEASPNHFQIVLRSSCNSLVPVTMTMANLKGEKEDKDSPIKSSVIERTSAINPVIFRSLQANTDISLPPDNWLKTSNNWERLIKKFSQTHVSSHTGLVDVAQSIQLANEAIEVLPCADVVANSETLKNLLRVPYDNEHILSLAIHRIGETFLIDDFDAYSYLIDAQRADWHWIRKWFSDNDGKRMALLLAASSCRNQAKSREKIRERDMLSKFLYYSIDENEYPAQTSPPSLPGALPSASSSVTLSADNVAPSLPKPALQKTALWTLEDMKILVGSDLPVFSTGSHPCFSLRLCDERRPINVITGLEYWLDNLMCNVPEVLMCYHIDGIVQQYEVFRTDDLPHLSENCQFSPHVVKDFASNILSFLRSNATKEGHTYWLLKEPDIDVVKLYDLTSLCEQFMDSVNDNPFSLPLAVLLCRLAYTILEQPDSTDEQIENIPRLLDSCLKLIDRSRYPWLYSVANYLYFISSTKRSLPSDNMAKNSAKSELASSKPIDIPFDKRSLLNLTYIANGLTFLASPSEGGKSPSNNSLAEVSRNSPVKWTPEQQNAMVAKLLNGAVNCYLHIAALDFDALVTRQGSSIATAPDQDGERECLCSSIRRNLHFAHLCLVALQSKAIDPTICPQLTCGILQLIGDLHFVNVEEHAGCIVQLDSNNMNKEDDLSEINQIIISACLTVHQNQGFDIGDYSLLSKFLGSPGDKTMSWPKWSSPIERIESAIRIYEKAFENSDDRAAVVRRLANACVEFANAIIQRSLELFEQGTLNSTPVDEPLELLWKKAYFAFDKAAQLFKSVRPVDVNNLAIVESNRARLMRVCAYCQPKNAVHYLSEAAVRYGVALKHLPKNSVGLSGRIHWDLSSVYLALADHHAQQSDENSDRTALKYLSDAQAEAICAGIPDLRAREADIMLREAIIRKRILLRLLDGGKDSKLCNNYLRLAEKSFEKCLAGYIDLRRWNDWAEAHQEFADLYLNFKVSSNFRKTIGTKIAYNLRAIISTLAEKRSESGLQWQAFSSEALALSCKTLAKLLAASGDQPPAAMKAVVEACKKLQNIVVSAGEKSGGNKNDISHTILAANDVIGRLKFSD